MKVAIDGNEMEIDSQKLDQIYDQIKGELKAKLAVAKEKGDSQYFLFALLCYNDASRRLLESILKRYSKEEIFEALTATERTER